ncbi:hypothetical protein CPB83DRAFT_780222 [Crepidotus variabilis]|uniref:DUF6593 domain-containing protein n=1 Tax=Crepidotus variabilis TaxID=179855 RepID=A0A9P6JVK4_9AGAR|nr:hypothetical protein CPB83DRAFT_780222 [Crepidotus variabilis]
MQLYLSSNTPWRADYSTEDGQILYKVDSPKFYGNVMKVSVAKVQTKGSHEPWAEIEYHSVKGDSTIKVGNVSRSTKDIFRGGKCSLSNFGENVFQASDGQEYTWVMTSVKCKLSRKSDDTPIATYHLKHYGIMSKSRPASLEIFLEGEGIVDDIITTFIYIEKRRTELIAIVVS